MSEQVATCSQCGQSIPTFKAGDFVEVELSGKWLHGLIIMGDATFSVAVEGYENLLAYGNPAHIPGAEKFLRRLAITAPESSAQ